MTSRSSGASLSLFMDLPILSNGCTKYKNEEHQYKMLNIEEKVIPQEKEN
jgi:hypothetical protein